MSAKTHMFIETSIGRFNIPFISLELLDSFTLQYKDDKLFKDYLIKVLKLPLTNSDFERIYLGCEDRGDLEENENYYLPVIYGKDNYNFDKLIQLFAEYLKKDNQKALNNAGIKQVAKSIIHNFKPGYASDNQILLIAKAYLNNNYRRIRDTYFKLSEEMNVKPILEPLNIKENSKTIREDLRKMESENNAYIQYLIELYSRGETEIALEALSKIDNEDLEKALGRTHHGIVDGLSDETLISQEEISSLEEVTGTSIETLREDIYRSLKINKRRGRWNILKTF